ncbi:MAG: hypothetical protein ACO3SO_02045 [Luteolibacter sp.]
MKRPQLPPLRPKGFSLIVTVSLLVVLTVVAVGLLSLSVISIKSTSTNSAEERARANARMALMMAIDRLQAQMGPDQRVSANAAILSATSDVANPHWMGVWDSWRAGDDGGNSFDRYPDALSSHSTIFLGRPGDPVPASMHPTYTTNREGHFREWLVSLDDDNAEILNAGRSLVLDAGYMPDQDQDAVVLVGQGTLGEGITDVETVKASLIAVDNTIGGGNTGRYGWWVGDESQKATIMADATEMGGAPTEAELLFRMQAAGSMGNEAVEELANITNEGRNQIDSVASRKSLDLIEGAIERPLRPGTAPTGASGNFHDLTTRSRGVLADVREGGLKRDLSTLLERPIVPLASESGVTDINEFALYRFPAKDGVLGSTEPQEIVPIQDLAAFYQLHNNGDSAPESGVRRSDITARGVQYNSSYLSGAPHLLGVNFGTLGNSPIYTREYTAMYRHPKILKVQLLFSMFAEERENWRDEANLDYPIRVLNSHELLLGVTPSMTLWNPTNLPVLMQMDPDQLVSNMFRMSDLPLRFRFRKEDRYGNTFESNFTTWLNGSIAGINGGFNLYWSGRHSVYLEPGEVKTFSLPYSGDLSQLKGDMGISNHWTRWNNSFFMKTDEYFEGHEVREGWEPESFILLPGSATGTNDQADIDLLAEQGVDLRDVVDNRLRFKRFDRITIEFDCGGGSGPINLNHMQNSYQRFDGGGTGARGTTYWGRRLSSIGSPAMGRGDRDPGLSFYPRLFARGTPSGQTNFSAPSRTGQSIISRSLFAAGWPCMQYSLAADSETNASSNSGIMGGRLTPGRPFLHSPVIAGSPFLAGDTGEDLYNFGYNWSANYINDVYEAPIQLNRENQSFYGGGYTPESGTTHVIQQEIPITPPLSIAALSGALLGGHSVATTDGLTYQELRGAAPNVRSNVLARAVGTGGLLPYNVQSIGNSYAHPQLNPDQAYKTIRRTIDNSASPIDETFADHSYLANKALWDEFFFSSITPQESHVEIFDATRSVDEVAEYFFFDGEKLPNTRMTPYLSDLDSSKLTNLLSEYDVFLDGMADKIAAHLMVNGPFNVNSTSMEAWKVLFSSMRGKDVLYNEPANALNGGNASTDSGIDGTPVGQVSLGGGRPYTGSQNNPNNPEQWTSMRELTDNEIEELAKAMVEQVKERGPFLSLSEFVNRRLDSRNREFSAKGALQAALDDYPDVTINSAFFRRIERQMSNAEITDMRPEFREAAEGPVAYGSMAYVDQADILRNFAAQLTPRGDTFVVRAYGDSLDASGNVEARAWCEAVVQRLPDYVEPGYQSSTGDEAHVKYEFLQSATNRTFGRKMEIVSFRWLHSSEI